jgi:hypothetical protein
MRPGRRVDAKASPLIARKSQRIDIANALVVLTKAGSKARGTKACETNVNSALSRVGPASFSGIMHNPARFLLRFVNPALVRWI